MKLEHETESPIQTLVIVSIGFVNVSAMFLQFLLCVFHTKYAFSFSDARISKVGFGASQVEWW